FLFHLERTVFEPFLRRGQKRTNSLRRPGGRTKVRFVSPIMWVERSAPSAIPPKPQPSLQHRWHTPRRRSVSAPSCASIPTSIFDSVLFDTTSIVGKIGAFIRSATGNARSPHRSSGHSARERPARPTC